MRQDRFLMETEISHGRADRDGPTSQTIGLQNFQASAGLVPQSQPRPLEEEVRGAQGRIQAAFNSKSRTFAVVERTGAQSEAAGREVQELRAQIAELQTRWDRLSEESAKKKAIESSRPR